jgi:hypothetical protein
MILQSLQNLLASTPVLSNPPATAVQVAKQAAILALVAVQGGGPKVYLLGSVPQATPAPYLVIEQLDGEGISSINGGQTGDEKGLARVHCYSTTATAAQQLAQLVGQLLDCFRGSAGSIKVQGIFQTDAQAQFPPPTHGDEAGNPVTVKDFEVWQTGSF